MNIKSLNIRYSRHSEPNFKLDIWKSDTVTTSAPAVLFFHGGGFTSGHRNETQYDVYAQAVVDHGLVWVSADYGLAPTYVMPQPIQHGFGALRFIRSVSGTYGIDPNKIAVSGGSAGSILATQMFGCQSEPTVTGTFADHTNITNKVSGLVAVSGAVYDPDLTNFSTDAESGIVAAFGSDTTYLPQHNLPPVGFPSMFLHGTADTDIPIIHAQNTVSVFGVSSQLITDVGTGHGMANANQNLPAIMSFLDSVFA